MGGLHSIRCIPGSRREKEFLQLMDDAGAKRELLICKRGDIFETEYDEYVISEGMYRLVRDEFERIREI